MFAKGTFVRGSKYLAGVPVIGQVRTGRPEAKLRQYKDQTKKTLTQWTLFPCEHTDFVPFDLVAKHS